MEKTKTLPSVYIISGSVLLLVAYFSLVIVNDSAAQSLLPGTKLTDDSSQDLRPTWSPDGSQLAYISGSAGNNDIWIMDEDGENKLQITTDLSDDRRPGWSPDGQWIVFDSDRTGNREVWVIPAEGGTPLQVTNSSALDNFPSWSLDGDKIAYFAYEGGITDIWVVALNDLLEGGEAGQPVRVTTNLADETKNQCTFACHSPSWSPDSSQLTYSAQNQTEIWVIDIDGSNPYQVVNDTTKILQGFEHFPSWTPDGRLLFLFEHPTSGGARTNDIWVMRPDGTNPTLVYEDIPHGGPLELRTDAVTVAFHSPRAGNFDIYTANLSQRNDEAEVIEEPSAEDEVIEDDISGEGEGETLSGTNVNSEEAVDPPSPNYFGIIGVLLLIGLGTGMIWYARRLT